MKLAIYFRKNLSTFSPLEGLARRPRCGEQGRRLGRAQDHQRVVDPGTTSALLLVPGSAPTTPDLSQAAQCSTGQVRHAWGTQRNRGSEPARRLAGRGAC